MNSVPCPEKNIVIVSGPAGSGKDSLIEEAQKMLKFERVITTTTRPKRDHEVEGEEYYFVSPSTFQAGINANEFVEYSQNENGAWYGVRREHFERALRLQKKLLWKVDWKGMQSAKKMYPSAKSVCIMAPKETLAKRIRSREGSMYTEDYFRERALYAQNYFDHADKYDYVIWNEDGKLKESVGQFTTILRKITSS